MQKHKAPGKLLTVGRHYSGKGNRYSGTGVGRNIEEADVVITTYTEVEKSFPKILVPKGINSWDEAKDWYDSRWDDVKGVLHEARFYRVVLDEVQTIKNYKTKTSLACRALEAKHRWGLPGTPISNELKELYPLFKFLRMPCTGDGSDFITNFCSPESYQRLHHLLDQVIVRRTHGNGFMGAPIHKLPKNTQNTLVVNFSPVEREIYLMVTKYLLTRVNRYGPLQ